ncbi:MAG: hypothetical protein IKI28_09650 [Bacteroidales bacterium]|nr:hypothetical protein [Bacteroidales bacterium]
MIALKPAIATTACAGLRRMEAEQPPALGMQTCGGKGAGQWLLAMDCAKVEHPSCNTSAHKGTKRQAERPCKTDENGLLNTHIFLKS